MQIDELIVKMKDAMGGGTEFFSNKIMDGYIQNSRINAYINPFSFIQDPFRSKVKGVIVPDGTQTKISLKISFGIVNILVLFFWYIPMIFILQQKANRNIESILVVFGICSALSLICFILLTLKLFWDKSRLEKWIRNNI